MGRRAPEGVVQAAGAIWRAAERKALDSAGGQESRMDLSQLREPAAQVRELIQGRIDLGETLLGSASSVNDRSTLESLEADESVWHRYNEVLLRKCFVGGDVADRYRRSRPVHMVSDLSSRARALTARIGGAITELRATVAILELLGERSPASAPEAGRPEERDAYFKELWQRTGGRIDASVSFVELGAAIGLSDAVRSDVEDYLQAEGLITFPVMGEVSLTHAGRVRGQSGGSASVTSATNQTINVFGDVNAPIQQAGSLGAQMVEHDEALGAAQAWLAELVARLDDGSLALSGDVLHEVRDHVEALKDELADSHPKKSILRSGFRAIGRVLEGAGGEIVATGLISGLPHVVHALT